MVVPHVAVLDDRSLYINGLGLNLMALSLTPLLSIAFFKRPYDRVGCDSYTQYSMAADLSRYLTLDLYRSLSNK